MKKLIILAVSMMLLSPAFCQRLQEKDVPAAVKTALKNQYPKVSEVKWNKELKNYEASFNLNQRNTSVLFNAFGVVLQTEEEIDQAKLPPTVLPYVSSRFPGKKVTEASQITTSGGAITYEVEIKELEMLFDASGQFLKDAVKPGQGKGKDHEEKE